MYIYKCTVEPFIIIIIVIIYKRGRSLYVGVGTGLDDGDSIFKGATFDQFALPSYPPTRKKKVGREFYFDARGRKFDKFNSLFSSSQRTGLLCICDFFYRKNS